MTQINGISWAIATVLLISCGIYYTFKLNFTQFSFKKMFKSLNNKESSDDISPFKSLTLALAGRIGVGSLAGIALGIYNGGIGVIFWIWLSSLITLPNSFVESSLAVMYHEKDGNNYKGGPSFYMEKGLELKRLAVIYSIIICICYLGGFLAIQANTIASSMKEFLSVPLIVSGITISIITYLIISKGLKRIANFTSLLVPIMGVLYMLVSLIIIIINIKSFPQVIVNIFMEAFNFKAIGWGIISSIIIGVQRGIFSSEAGIGTGAIASGTCNTSPFNQGYLQMLGVYFTSFIICTGTAFIIIISDIDMNLFKDVNGIEITLRALNTQLGNLGTIVLIISIVTFAFSTIISGYYYGESNIKYLYKKLSNKQRIVLNIFVVIVLIYGSIARPSFLWNIVDIGVAVLAIINCYALLKARKIIIDKYRKEK